MVNSGSGKTYTLFGNTRTKTPGLFQKTLESLQELSPESLNLVALQLYIKKGGGSMGVYDAFLNDDDYGKILKELISDTKNIYKEGDKYIKNIVTNRGKDRFIDQSSGDDVNNIIKSKIINIDDYVQGDGPWTCFNYTSKTEESKEDFSKRIADELPFEYMNKLTPKDVDTTVGISVKKEDFGKNGFNTIYDVLERIENLRPTRSTLMNPESSRSHLFLIFKIKFPGKEEVKVTFIDLAGNETIKGGVGTDKQEGDQINKSLTVLQNMMKYFQAGKFDDNIKTSGISTRVVRDIQPEMFNMMKKVIRFDKTSDKVLMFLMVHSYLFGDIERNKITGETTKKTLEFAQKLAVGLGGLSFGKIMKRLFGKKTKRLKFGRRGGRVLRRTSKKRKSDFTKSRRKARSVSKSKRKRRRSRK